MIELLAWLKKLFSPRVPAKVIPIRPLETVIPIDLKKPSSAPWMDFLGLHIGEHEISGDKANPFIVSLFKHTSYKTDSDETPWCAATICAALEACGFESTKSAAAISYKNYGVSCERKYGAILVIEHPSGKHHVTCFHHVGPGSIIYCLGGNQSDQIKISAYDLSKEKVIACRWPL